MSNFFGLNRSKMNMSGNNFPKGKFVKTLSTGKLMLNGRAVTMTDFNKSRNS
jgi:hypothetical protein